MFTRVGPFKAGWNFTHFGRFDVFNVSRVLRSVGVSALLCVFGSWSGAFYAFFCVLRVSSVLGVLRVLTLWVC